MKQLFTLLFLPVLAFAQPSSKEFRLQGRLHLTDPVSWVYLRYSSDGHTITDSTRPKDGVFAFRGKITEPVVATLITKSAPRDGNGLANREMVPLFLEPARLEFSATDSLQNNTVTGAAGHSDLMGLVKQQQDYDTRMEALYDAYDSLQRSGDKEGMNRVEGEIAQLDSLVKEKVYGSFVKAHPGSPLALYALQQYAGWDIDVARVEPLFDRLPAQVRSWPSAKALADRIAIARKTAIGNYALDFTQNDTAGHPVSLSSFRGKYVLLDFWASWCGPCRRENPNVVREFNKFREKNFTVLSVSLDQPNARDKWLAAIHKDGLTWTHVSDLKYWDNAVAKEYGIRAIPQNLLLDPQGKIIGKNLRGEELDEKLSALIR